MAETRTRREPSSRPRTNRPSRPVLPQADVEDEVRELDQQTATNGDGRFDEAPPAPPRAEPTDRTDSEIEEGFDQETNARYEEVKRGGIHITELQQMTMPQLLK